MSKYDKMLEVNHKQSVEKIQRAKLAIQEMIEEEDKSDRSQTDAKDRTVQRIFL